MKTPRNPTTLNHVMLCALTAAACLTFGTGCRITRSIRLDHAAGEAGVLKTVPAMKLALEVIDERPAAERVLVAKVAKVDYVVAGGVVPTLESALRAEFEKAGHQVAAAGDGVAPVTLRVAVQRFWAGCRQTGGGTAIEKFAEINAMVRIGQVVFPVSVRQSKVYPLAAPGGLADVANPAYEEFIRNVTMDPQLIAALKAGR